MKPTWPKKAKRTKHPILGWRQTWIRSDGLAKVYDSAAARRYRGGCSACRDCPIRPVCGGCLAVAHGFGLDPLRERDPLCFLKQTNS